MKKILILSATASEIESITTSLSPDIDLLISGIGLVNTALSLERYLQTHTPAFILQAGIGGSWENRFPIGSVVQVREEIYGDLGADSPHGFLDLETLGFENFQYKGKSIYNQMTNPWAPLPFLTEARGISVQKVHGRKENIQETYDRWKPEVESMEGASFFQVCLQHKIPFAEIRAISNRVESRNRENWNISLALTQLHQAIFQILEPIRARI